MRCGVENPGGLYACRNCGNSLAVDTAQAAQTSVPPPMQPPMPFPRPTPLWGAGPFPVKQATAGTILGDTFTTFGKDFAGYAGIYLIYGISVFLFTEAVSRGVNITDFPTIPLDLLYRYIAHTLAIAVVGLAIQSVLTATLTVFAVHRHQGLPTSIRVAFRRGFPKVLSILGASLVPGLLLGVSFAAFGSVVLYGVLTNNLVLTCGAGALLVAMFPVSIYLTIALSLSAPAIVMEGRSAIGGLKRSWELTRGRRLTLFAVLIVLAFLIFLINLAATLPFGFSANRYASSIGGIIGTAITGSWTMIMAAVAYNLIIPGGNPAPNFGPPDNGDPSMSWPPRPSDMDGQPRRVP